MTNDTIKVDSIIESKGVAIGPNAQAFVYEGLTIEQVGELVGVLKRTDQPKVWDGRVPYLGLRSFQESDAEFFFGRQALVDDLLARMAEASFIVLAGPSGSGKSSVARAGLFHALRQNSLPKSSTWLRSAMRPEGDPLENLARAIDRAAQKPGSGDFIRANGLTDPLALSKSIEVLLTDDRDQRFVLLVDQFEEVFTQTRDEAARLAFISQLTTAAEAPNGRAVIIVALRADFVSNCAAFPELRRLMSKQFQLVGAMDPKDLATAITLPALEVGADIDPALVKKIIDDMKGEPGALPLMSFALLDLFEAESTTKGKPMDMTLAEYLQRGGIESALERHANEVFAQFSAEQQVLARSIFSRLVEVGQGRVDTRRTVTFAELVPAGQSETLVAATVSELAEENARLLTTSGVGDAPGAEGLMTATVTIAHEKLIDAWPWLRKLVDESRELIALQNQIDNDARTWDVDKDGSYLYRGGRLAQVEENYDLIRPGLNEQSERFIEAGLLQRAAELQAAEDRIREQEALTQERANARRFKQQRRWLGVVAIVAAIASVIALGLMLRARAAETEISDLKTSIQASQLALASRAELDADPGLGQLLATTALGLSSQPDTLASFYNAMTSPYGTSLPHHTYHVRSAVFSPEGTRIVTASHDRSAKVWDLNGNELASLEGHTDWVTSAVFNHDGTQIVTASHDRSARVWDLDGNELASLDGHMDNVYSAAFSPDGKWIVTASDDGSARVWDLDGKQIASLDGHLDRVRSAVFSPDGTRIVTASEDGTARVWNLDGNELTRLEGHSYDVVSAIFGRDGTRIVTASSDASAKVWDLDGNELVSLNGHTNWVRSAAFSPDGKWIVTASDDGSAKVWDLDGNNIVSLEGQTDVVYSADFSPNGMQILTVSEDSSANVWDWFPTVEDRVYVALLNDVGRGFYDEECFRFFRNDLESCPRTRLEVFALFDDDLGQ